ncbi:hypothetical protein LLS1_06760 [Leifsonia sp. LS1]|uniref:DUF4386 domain-containing protein n=1 Tax=Leifsonia sp. LS1 TaxID=2828483 RepID=UPI001CFD39C6|nr:DUF4386 domain-containing protein [Leifsonia sp. LS1]GIT79007.1 hypothetical protein LLS1_06760 [Leifsonia sp. LS1]
MAPLRRTSLAVGVLYLVTHATSVVATVLYAPLLGGASGSVVHGAARTGALLEVVLALSVVGTAVGLYPVVKRSGAAFALGHVALRTLEAAIILTGVASVLALDAARGAEPAGGGPVTAALVALHDATFLLGPNVVLIASTALLAILLLRSGLVPRWIPILGLVGCASLLASAMGILYGLIPQVSAAGGIAAAPMFAWELSLALYLLIVGMRESAPAHTATPDAPAHVRTE